MMRPETRVPDIPPPPAGVDPAVRDWMLKVIEVLQVREGRRGDPLDQGVTKRDLVASGMASAVGGGLSGVATGGAVVPRGAGPKLQPRPSPNDLTPAPAATGFTLSTGEETFLLEWDAPTYKTGGGHAYTEVWMAVYDGTGDLPTIGNAIILDRVPASIYAHTPGPGVTAHFWLRHVTRNGVAQAAPTGGTNGLSGTTGPGGDVLDEIKLGKLRVASLVAGDGTISGILKSANYVGNSLGWRIGRDGDVEFNDATIRGVIYAAAGLIGGNVIAEDRLESPNWSADGYGWRLGSDGIIKSKSEDGGRIFDLGATGTQPVLKIGAALEIRADGTASYGGALSSGVSLEAPTITGGAISGGTLSAANVSVGPAGAATTFSDPAQPAIPLMSLCASTLNYSGNPVTFETHEVPGVDGDGNPTTNTVSTNVPVYVTGSEATFKNGSDTWTIERRVRTGPVLFIVMCSASVEQFLAIWYRINGDGWINLGYATEYGSGFGSTSLSRSVQIDVASGDTVEFAMTCTDGAGNLYSGSGGTSMQNASLTVLAKNF